MSTRMKHLTVIAALLLALGVVGHMDQQDAQCSWNGCGDDRFTQE